MPFIEVDNLVREFRTYKRFKGPLGAVRSLFTRQYDVRKAVDGVSFEVARGEAVGYVGPNGAGKSTTVKMLTGILVPTSGSVLVNGRVPHLQRVENSRRMGVVFGQRSQLWWDLALQESFELHRHMYGIPGERFRRNLAFCEELLGVGEFASFPVRQLSLGQRMRAEVALALLHEPEVLFLDEPTIGLDVLVKDRIRHFLREANRERGVTIMLTTHDLRDIEEICPRLLVIDHGRIVWDGKVNELKSRFQSTRTLTVEFEEDPGNIELANATLEKADGKSRTFRFDRRQTTAPALLSSLGQQRQVVDASIAEADIEDVIRGLYADLGRTRPPENEEIDTWSRGRAVTQ